MEVARFPRRCGGSGAPPGSFSSGIYSFLHIKLNLPGVNRIEIMRFSSGNYYSSLKLIFVEVHKKGSIE